MSALSSQRLIPATGNRSGAKAACRSHTYRVGAGDDLLRIASRIYGKPDWWPRIFEANRDVLATPLAVRPGQLLVVPDP